MTSTHLTSASGCLVYPAISGLLSFGSDVGLRTRLFSTASLKLHLGLLCWLVDRYTCPEEIIATWSTDLQGYEIIYTHTHQLKQG